MESPLAIGVCCGLFSHSFNKQKHRERGGGNVDGCNERGGIGCQTRGGRVADVEMQEQRAETKCRDFIQLFYKTVEKERMFGRAISKICSRRSADIYHFA
jgi:hypothetical protein